MARRRAGGDETQGTEASAVTQCRTERESPSVPLPFRWESRPQGRATGRPLWLLDRPEPCDVDRLVLEEGPECIESGWWDGHDVARDYYIARNAQGARLWVFRKRRETTAGARWFLHGWFA